MPLHFRDPSERKPHRFTIPDTPWSIVYQCREYPAHYLTQEQRDSLKVRIRQYALERYNSLEEFAKKVQALPPNLRQAATQGFMAQVDFSHLPDEQWSAACCTLFAVRLVWQEVTGLDGDFVTEENKDDLVVLLVPFLDRDLKLGPTFGVGPLN
jgi:hypothetical protein